MKTTLHGPKTEHPGDVVIFRQEAGMIVQHLGKSLIVIPVVKTLEGSYDLCIGVGISKA